MCARKVPNGQCKVSPMKVQKNQTSLRILSYRSLDCKIYMQIETTRSRCVLDEHVKDNY